jgi:hypothetical protein
MLISCAHRCVEQVGGNRVVRRKVASGFVVVNSGVGAN